MSLLNVNDDWKKNLVLFLSSQTLSLFGSSLVQYAIMWHITLTTQSGAMMTIAIVGGFLPTFFVSPFAGVWADRYDRKKIIVFSDSAIALSTLVLALLFFSGHGSLWLLFVVSAVRAFGAGIQTPTVGAILPQLVPEDKLTTANGANGSIQAIVMLVSPMVSGALLTIAPIETIFFVDVATAAIAVFILLRFVRVRAYARAAGMVAKGYLADMREGVLYITGHRYLKGFYLFCTIFFLLAAPVAFLTPLQVARTFGGDVWRLTAIEVAFSVGMMAGGGLIALWGGFRNRVHTMALAAATMGICTLAFGVIPDFWIYLACMAICGLSMPLFNTPSAVLLQEKVEAGYLGRVFGVLGMISSSMMPLGMLVFGPIADVVAIEWLLIGTGLLMVVQTLFIVGNKVLVAAGVPVSPPEPCLVGARTCEEQD